MMEAHCSAELMTPGRTGRSVLDILLEKDVRILACGSLSCLRGLYKACCQRGAQGRLIPCYITRGQYAIGTWEAVLLQALREALEADGTIVLYVSCTEVIAGCDYQGLLERLGPEVRGRVRVFFRGPLISRRERLSETAAGLVSDLPPAKEDYGRAVLPVPAVDFDGIRELAAAWGMPCVLLSPGGCGACMTPTPEARCVLTRFDDLFASCPDWEALFYKALELCPPGETPIFLKTAISSLLMPPYTEGLLLGRGSFAPCSGWGSAVRGISDFLLESVQRWSRGRQVRPGKVCALGASRLLSPLRTLPVEAWTPKDPDLPERTVVVTSAGMAAAEYLWKQFGIPYTPDACIRELPGALGAWVGGLGILADPVAADSLEKELLKSCPGREVRKLLYCPLKEDRLFYSRFPECRICPGEKELEAALTGCRVLLADPCFAPWLAAHCPDCRLIPLPYLALGG